MAILQFRAPTLVLPSLANTSAGVLKQVSIVLDGEEMDDNDTLESLEVEDGDRLDAGGV